MNIFIGVLCSLILGYLLGSLSFGVIIGKVFFGIDVRTQGSHNSGGTNTGRVLGKKVGLIVILLDAFKAMGAIWIVYFICKIPEVQNYLVISPSYYAYIAGISACIGHTFPCFFSFKGGKAVACLGGICLATNWIISLLGLTIFLVVLFIFKYVSLSSIVTSISVIILSCLPFVKEYGMNFSLTADLYYTLLLSAVALLLILRHHSNISRLIKGKEPKVSWLSKHSK